MNLFVCLFVCLFLEYYFPSLNVQRAAPNVLLLLLLLLLPGRPGGTPAPSLAGGVVNSRRFPVGFSRDFLLGFLFGLVWFGFLFFNKSMVRKINSNPSVKSNI